MAKKLLPYINRFTGDIKVATKSEGSKLSEDWSRAKMAINDKGEKVFRFKLDASVVGRDGKTHMGTATVDLTESEVPLELEAANGNGNPK